MFIDKTYNSGTRNNEQGYFANEIPFLGYELVNFEKEGMNNERVAVG